MSGSTHYGHETQWARHVLVKMKSQYTKDFPAERQVLWVWEPGVVMDEEAEIREGTINVWMWCQP